MQYIHIYIDICTYIYICIYVHTHVIITCTHNTLYSTPTDLAAALPGVPLAEVLQTGVFGIVETCLALMRKHVLRDHEARVPLTGVLETGFRVT